MLAGLGSHLRPSIGQPYRPSASVRPRKSGLASGLKKTIRAPSAGNIERDLSDDSSQRGLIRGTAAAARHEQSRERESGGRGTCCSALMRKDEDRL